MRHRREERILQEFDFLLWTDENPHAVRQSAFQNRWAINVWAGIKANQIVSSISLLVKKKNFSVSVCIAALFLKSLFFDNFQIGPYILPPRLNGEIYARFLENELPGLLEDVSLRERQELIFQHDGAPAHFSRQA